MFQKQQIDNDLQKSRQEYNRILEKGKQLGLDEVAHVYPVCRSENDTHPIVESRGGSFGDHVPRSTHETRNVYSHCYSRDFIKDDCIPEGDVQVASGSVSLPDPVVLETEEQMTLAGTT